MTKPTDSARLHGAITSSDQEDQWSFANRAYSSTQVWTGPRISGHEHHDDMTPSMFRPKLAQAQTQDWCPT